MHDKSANHKPTLLHVEDEEDTANLVRLIMEAKGYHVVRAVDGREAQHLIGSMAPPTLVLLDIQLPHVNGVKVLDTIRATPDWDDVPVVMLTAVADEQNIREVFSLNVTDYVLKPFKPEALVAYLEQFHSTLPQGEALRSITPHTGRPERIRVGEASRSEDPRAEEHGVAQDKEQVHVDSSFEPLIPRFMNNRKKEVAAMQQAFAREDFETVRTISHGMKGAAGIYGFDLVMEMAALIEDAAKMHNGSIIRRELPRLNIYLNRIKVLYD